MKKTRESFHHVGREKEGIAKHDGRHSIFLQAAIKTGVFDNHGPMPLCGIAPHPIMFLGALSMSGRIFSARILNAKKSPPYH